MEASGQFHTPAVQPQGNSPHAHWIGHWVIPEPVWTVYGEEKKFHVHARNGTQVIKPPACHYTDWAIQPPYKIEEKKEILPMLVIKIWNMYLNKHILLSWTLWGHRLKSAVTNWK
jgi:hypothetical protein